MVVFLDYIVVVDTVVGTVVVVVSTVVVVVGTVVVVVNIVPVVTSGPVDCWVIPVLAVH